MESYFKLQPSFNPLTGPAGFSTSVWFGMAMKLSPDHILWRTPRAILSFPGLVFPSQDPFALPRVPPGFPSTGIGGTDVGSCPSRSLTPTGTLLSSSTSFIYLFIYFSAQTTAHVHGVLLCLSGPQSSSTAGWVC